MRCAPLGALTASIVARSGYRIGVPGQPLHGSDVSASV